MKSLIKTLACILAAPMFFFSCSDSSDDPDFRPANIIETLVVYESEDIVSLDSIKSYYNGVQINVDYYHPLTLRHNLTNRDSYVLRDNYAVSQVTGSYIICDMHWELIWGNENPGYKEIKVVGYKNDKIIFEETIRVWFDGNNIYSNENKELRSSVPESGDMIYHNILRYKIVVDESKRFCTPEESIKIEVQDKDGNPVALDYYKVKFMNGKIITPYELDSDEFKEAQKTGLYTIVDDSSIPEFEKLESWHYRYPESVIVSGASAKHGDFSEEFYIGAGECHVISLDNKPRKITINP